MSGDCPFCGGSGWEGSDWLNNKLCRVGCCTFWPLSTSPEIPDVYLIYLTGTVPSKKNEKIPTFNKAGKLRMHYQAQPEINSLAKQIEPQFRDLGLLHPDVEIWFFASHGRGDRDGKEATVLDLLKAYGTIQDDCIARFNGTVTIHPAIRRDVEGVLVKLTDTRIDRWPEKEKKKCHTQNQKQR